MTLSFRSRSRSISPEPADWSSSTAADSPRDPYDLPPPEQGDVRAIRRANPPLPPPRGPQLTPADGPRVNALVLELQTEIRGRERFQDFGEADILWAAETFVRYRIANVASLRRTDREARAMFIKDLREVEKRTFPEMQLILQLLNHFAPQQVKQRPNEKNPAYEEIVLAAKLGPNGNFMVDFRGLSAFLKPSQEMANFISQELARGMNKIPTYPPFIVPELSKTPWPVASQAHSAALTKWQSSARQANRASDPQLVPFQAWLLYQLRFIMTAEVCGAWQLFGGLTAQLNHLSIVLHLSTVETMAVALSYDRLVKAFLAEKARAREEHSQPGPGAENEFMAILSTEQQLFRQQALLENPRTAVSTAMKEVKPKKALPKSSAQHETPKSDKGAWKVKRKRSASRQHSPRKRSPFRKDNPQKRRKENDTPKDFKKQLVCVH